MPLASALNRRVFGLQAKSPQRFATPDQMIDEYVGCIRRQQPHGPYVLAGWSYGAFLAAGAAQRPYAKGEQVPMVLIDPVCRQDFCCENRAALLRLCQPKDKRASGTARTFRPADARQPACRLYQPR
ncbi:thioesterase domain-containing protein [Klebsiella pneumoniae]|nr:thioesterase domain-containing protein [Klebsiella pneumoniae]